MENPLFKFKLGLIEKMCGKERFSEALNILKNSELLLGAFERQFSGMLYPKDIERIKELALGTYSHEQVYTGKRVGSLLDLLDNSKLTIDSDNKLGYSRNYSSVHSVQFPVNSTRFAPILAVGLLAPHDATPSGGIFHFTLMDSITKSDHFEKYLLVSLYRVEDSKLVAGLKEIRMTFQTNDREYAIKHESMGFEGFEVD